jgi:hypothetical protein
MTRTGIYHSTGGGDIHTTLTIAGIRGTGIPGITTRGTTIRGITIPGIILMPTDLITAHGIMDRITTTVLITVIGIIMFRGTIRKILTTAKGSREGPMPYTVVEAVVQ